MTAATASAVAFAWDSSSDNVGVTGYYVYAGFPLSRNFRVSVPTFTAKGLGCGDTLDVWVTAFDRAKNLSQAAAATVSTAPCPDVEAPTEPTGFLQRVTTQDTVVLAWDPSTDNAGVVAYEVYRDGVPVTSTTEPVATLSGLVCGSLYVVGVDAVDPSGNSSTQGIAWVQTASCPDVQPPSPPTELVVSGRTQTSVTLEWSASSDDVGVAGYRVSTGDASLTVSGTTATISDLTCATTYAVSVDAYDAAGNRSAAATTSAATADCPAPPPPPPLGDSTPPTQPTGLAVDSATATSVSLKWAASSDNVGVGGYGVYVNGSKVLSTSQLVATVSGLTCGTAYSVDVDAYDATGNRSSSASITASTAACTEPPPPPPSDTTAPTQPTGLSVTGRTTTSVTLSWTASTDTVGVTGYRVQTAGAATQTVAGTTATVSNLTCGTSYSVSVDAYDAAGNHSSAATTSATTAGCPLPPPPPADTTPPSQPSELSVTGATGTSVSLAWQAATDNVGVTGYGVYVNGAKVQSPTQTAATLTGLTCGTAYALAVDAYDAAGNRSTKASITATTAACPDAQAPTAPSNVTATSRTATSIALSWSPSSDNVGVVGYGYYGGTTLVGTTVGTTVIFSGLTCNTNYTLAVDAYDAAGNRSTKTTVGVATTACPDTTAPSTPSSLATSNVTGTGLTLGWSASTDNVGVTGYHVYRNGTKVSSGASTSSAQSGLTCGTSYSFAVEAYDAAGNTSARATLSASTAACSPPPPPPTGEPGPIAGQGYRMSFDEQFSTFSGGTWGQGIWYNPGSPANSIFVQDGVLNLASRRSQAYQDITVTTESAGIAFQQGYFEARMKWTKGAGAWPAFWLLSYRHATNPAWPSINPYCQQNALLAALCYSAELDVFEGQGTEPTVFYGTIHRNSCDCYAVSNTQNSNNYHGLGTDLTAGFHTYGMLWTATTISWYLDGQFIHSAPVYDSTNQPQFLLLQMWIGGWTKGTDSTTPDELRTEVDWVRVWQK